MNALTGIKKLSCFLAVILIPNFCYADAYKPSFISDIRTEEKDGGHIRLSDRSVEFTLSYQTSSSGIDKGIYAAHSPDNVRYMVKDSWEVLKQFLRSKSVPYEDCREDYNIHIFVVNKSVFSEPERFKAFFKKYNLQQTSLLGYYDSTLEIERNSVILVSDVSSYSNNALLAHELSHYWWDRMCLGSYFKNGSESFADQFQDYYEVQR